MTCLFSDFEYEASGMTNRAPCWRKKMAVVTWWIGYGWLWWSNSEESTTSSL